MNAALIAEFHDFVLFLKAILMVGAFTGLGVVPFILLGYELQTKRRA